MPTKRVVIELEQADEMGIEVIADKKGVHEVVIRQVSTEIFLDHKGIEELIGALYEASHIWEDEHQEDY